MRETRSAYIELHTSGCVLVRTRPGIVQTVDDARENVAVSVEVSGDRRLHPLMVKIIEPLRSEVRHYYVGGALAENFSALGLVVEGSPLGRMMGNVFLGMMERVSSASRRLPTRLFVDEESALTWLTARK